MQLHMSLVDRAGPVTGRIPPWVHSPVSEMRNQNEKRPKILGTSSGAKANMARNKIYNIRAYESFGNSWSCITAVTVSMRSNDALYQTRQMEAKLPINAALELTPHLIRRMRRLFEDNKKKKSTTLSQQNKARFKRRDGKYFMAECHIHDKPTMPSMVPVREVVVVSCSSCSRCSSCSNCSSCSRCSQSSSCSSCTSCSSCSR